MIRVFTVTYNTGGIWDDYQEYLVGIFSSYKLAKSFVDSCGYTNNDIKENIKDIDIGTVFTFRIDSGQELEIHVRLIDEPFNLDVIRK